MAGACPPRPHVFVGSSKEQLRWARAVHGELDEDGEVTVWTQGVFRPTRADLTSIAAEARRSDFAIFIFAPDDLATIRSEEHAIVRDNVIFELGLFVGELGPERCFLLIPRQERLHLPTDVAGVPTLEYEPDRPDGNRAAAVGSACHRVRDEIECQGIRPRSPFADVEAALAAATAKAHSATAGLVGTYPRRASAFADIAASIAGGGCIRLLSNKGDDWLGDGGAASPALLALRAEGTRFELRTILLHPNSPWLTGEGLRVLQRGREQVLAEFEAAHALVEAWCGANGCPPPRYHRHNPAWRFIQTKQALFISTYVTDGQMAAEPVLRFTPQSPIYRSVERYFDFIYENFSAPRSDLAPFERLSGKQLSQEASAGVVLTRGSGGAREVLLVRRADGAMALPKGHIEDGELPIAAALRELLEETGAGLDASRLSFLGIRPVGYVLPTEVVVKVILFYRAEDPGGVGIDPAKAAWVQLTDIPTVRLVDDYIAGLLAGI